MARADGAAPEGALRLRPCTPCPPSPTTWRAPSRRPSRPGRRSRKSRPAPPLRHGAPRGARGLPHRAPAGGRRPPRAARSAPARGPRSGRGRRRGPPAATARPPRRRPGRIVVGTEGERTVRRGGHAGDRAVRIVRPRLPGLRVHGRGLRPGGAGAGADDRRRAPVGGRLKRTPDRGAPSPPRCGHERLTKLKALAGLRLGRPLLGRPSPPRRSCWVLLLAGAAALSLILPIGVGIVVLLLAIVGHLLPADDLGLPRGGGSYIVAKDNLGTTPGLVAGAALLIDYVLTVAVSVSAGVAAITSAFPSCTPTRCRCASLYLAVMTLLNLRGIASRRPSSPSRSTPSSGPCCSWWRRASSAWPWAGWQPVPPSPAALEALPGAGRAADACSSSWRPSPGVRRPSPGWRPSPTASRPSSPRRARTPASPWSG